MQLNENKQAFTPFKDKNIFLITKSQTKYGLGMKYEFRSHPII